ncbi:MAG: beta-carotene 15,15'-dioxygenase, Brp/Blh family [Bacteroidota bacterium]
MDSIAPGSTYDVVFIGLGAANSLLALRLGESGQLSGKTIAVIEPASFKPLDRTFCFWSTPAEVEALHLQKLISHSWETVDVPGIASECIAPLQYYHVPGSAVRCQAVEELNRHGTHFIELHVNADPSYDGIGYVIPTVNGIVRAHRVYDSRPPEFAAPQKHQVHLLQSFQGWIINTIQPVFDEKRMVLMDFSVPQIGSTQFMYVLPFSSHNALVELTRFGNQVLSQEEATPILRTYAERLGTSYTVEAFESGVIPMSTCETVQREVGPAWINTGTRANLLKASTGYAFLAMAKDAMRKSSDSDTSEVHTVRQPSGRFAFYDRLLLKILEKQPEHGKRIFESLFRNTPISSVLRFLTEKSSPLHEAKMFSGLPVALFVKAAVKDMVYRAFNWPTAAYAFMLTMLFLLFSLAQAQGASWIVLGLGFLFVGLTHGALDHLTDTAVRNTPSLLRFIAVYVAKGLLLGLVWMFFPSIALALFIGYSAWHFGQADFGEWGFRQGWKSFAWGLSLLMLMLFSHPQETQWVVNQIYSLQSLPGLPAISTAFGAKVSAGCALFGLALTFHLRSKRMLLTLSYLMLCTFLPLLISFGIYFVAQHSVNGWRQLRRGLNQGYKPLLLKSLPFSSAAAVFMVMFMAAGAEQYAGIFFILLSCLSIPHVLSMHQFYRVRPSEASST